MIASKKPVAVSGGRGLYRVHVNAKRCMGALGPGTRWERHAYSVSVQVNARCVMAPIGRSVQGTQRVTHAQWALIGLY